MEMWWQALKCRDSIHNKASQTATQRSPFYQTRAHERVLHNGVRETLTELRSMFWIIRGRSVVKSTIRQCTVCLRYEGKPYNIVTPPPLQSFVSGNSYPLLIQEWILLAPYMLRKVVTTEQVRFGFASTHVVWYELRI